MTLLSLAIAIAFGLLFLKVTGLLLHLIFGPLALVFVVVAVYFYATRGRKI
jgi:hypothetical protein